MPRELVTVQVGQCGNQIAMKFWDLALQEHATYNQSGRYDDPLSAFFRNVDTRYSNPQELPVGEMISTLKARAVVVDTEEGVINEMLRSDLGEIFDTRHFVSDISGAGNNWAHGHFEYGNKHADLLQDQIRYVVEQWESIQSFFLMHSMGGGTGSGLGTRILKMLEDYYPEVFRFSTVVFPEDDVVTGPYNSLLALSELKQHADCVLPVDNKALFDILARVETIKQKTNKVKETIVDTGNKSKKAAFEQMNSIIAHMLNNLTCSMRFEGTLNVDLNEITMNLVPFPRMNFLISSMSPIYSLLDLKMEPRRLDQVFTDATNRDFQLLKVDPAHSTYMAIAFLLRGDAKISDLNRNVNRLRPQLNMIHWNPEGFKIGLCNQSAVGMPYSLLWLANNSSIKNHFNDLRSRFMKIYRRKAHVHHYTEYMEASQFDWALEELDGLISAYGELDNPSQMPTRPRQTPLIQQQLRYLKMIQTRPYRGARLSMDRVVKQIKERSRQGLRLRKPQQQKKTYASYKELPKFHLENMFQQDFFQNQEQPVTKQQVGLKPRPRSRGTRKSSYTPSLTRALTSQNSIRRLYSQTPTAAQNSLAVSQASGIVRPSTAMGAQNQPATKGTNPNSNHNWHMHTFKRVWSSQGMKQQMYSPQSQRFSSGFTYDTADFLSNIPVATQEIKLTPRIQPVLRKQYLPH